MKLFCQIFKQRPRVLEVVKIPIAEHCNLSCAYCTHYSPIADPKFSTLASVDRDLKRLGQLTGGFCKRIEIYGGEPLLNPDIIKYIELARQYMPSSYIQILTNGIRNIVAKDGRPILDRMSGKRN